MRSATQKTMGDGRPSLTLAVLILSISVNCLLITSRITQARGEDALTPSEALTDRECKREDSIIEEIKKDGVGGRFTIAEMSPQEGGEVGGVTIKPGTSETFALEFVCSKDNMIIRNNQIIPPSGHGSVLRFKGKVDALGLMIDGDNADPLVFVLWKGSGLVYVKGKGNVTLANGSIVNLPLER